MSTRGAPAREARATADKFQMPEARMTARLSIVQNALGAQPTNVNNRNPSLQYFVRWTN